MNFLLLNEIKVYEVGEEVVLTITNNELVKQ